MNSLGSLWLPAAVKNEESGLVGRASVNAKQDPAVSAPIRGIVVQKRACPASEPLDKPPRDLETTIDVIGVVEQRRRHTDRPRANGHFDVRVLERRTHVRLGLRRVEGDDR